MWESGKNNMKKRLFSGILAFLMMLTLGSCAGNHEHGLSAEEPTTITLWHYYNGALKSAFDTMVDEFNETVGKEKGIIVDAFGQGSVNDLADAVAASANKDAGAEELPDVFATYVDTALELDKMDLLAPLDDYLTGEEIAEYVPSYIEEGRLGADGKLKVFPVAKSTELLMINKTAFEPFAAAAGVSTDDLSTWEGLAEVAEKYYDYSGGKAFFGRDAYANYMIIGSLQLGTELFKVDKGEVTLQLDKDIMRRLWDNLYVPYVNGYFSKYGRFATDDAKTGDIIALVGSSSGASYFPTEVSVNDQESEAIECMVLPVPNFEGTEPYAVQQGAGMAVVRSDEQHEYASVVFLEWFTEKERNTEFSLMSAYLPVKQEANDPDLVHSVMEGKQMDISPVVKDSIEVGINQAKDYTLYTNKAFDNGYNARQILENSMLERAQENRALVLEKIGQGVPHDEAVAEYLTDEQFEQWYQELETMLDQTLKAS